ncbi:MAG TPA: NUDIX hydrolase, partial [Candidatus Saccharimonadales bacterium]|nr:NUDIX hydrolase [Candidatus Saccharimonadales bacterium]
MKISFSPPNDNVTHTYCLTCNQEGMVTDIFVEGLQKFYCTHCHHINERALIIDPSINWWVDDTGEYWHESAGIFLYNTQGQFLFFSRTKSPYGITVPAGHVDRDELSEHAAIRELSEEVNVRVTHVSKIATQDIHGDKCRRGADVHRWHIYAAMLP